MSCIARDPVCYVAHTGPHSNRVDLWGSESTQAPCPIILNMSADSPFPAYSHPSEELQVPTGKDSGHHRGKICHDVLGTFPEGTGHLVGLGSEHLVRVRGTDQGAIIFKIRVAALSPWLPHSRVLLDVNVQRCPVGCLSISPPWAPSSANCPLSSLLGEMPTDTLGASSEPRPLQGSHRAH